MYQLCKILYYEIAFMSHNHPSENLKPNDQYITLTNKIMEDGKLMDVKV